MQMKRRSTPCCWIACAVLFMTAAQPVRCADSGDSGNRLLATIDRPTTAIEALRNLKFALDHDLFLRDDFYSDDNLRKFFAAGKISWELFRPTLTTGTSPSLDIYLMLGRFDEKGNFADNGRKRGGGNIDRNLTADLVIEVFGRPMRITNPYAAESPVHPTPVMPKTHALGNLFIEYSFDHPAATALFGCRFNGDGTVRSCAFYNTDK
jgi:hypothetical protein